MPRVAKKRTDLYVRNLKGKPDQTRPLCYAVGGVSGLHIQVAPTAQERSGKSWLLRYSIEKPDTEPKFTDKKDLWRNYVRREIGLGDYPTVTLEQAREIARGMKEKINEGIDPLAERRKAKTAMLAEMAKAITFREVATQYLEVKGEEWKNPKDFPRWTNAFETYAYPLLGKLQIEEIDTAHILNVLKQKNANTDKKEFWKAKGATAVRLQGHIENVFDFALARKYRTGDNPARWRGHLDHLLPKKGKASKTEHLPALPVEDMARFFAHLQEQDSTGAKALAFGILTAARSGEVRGATWEEIDLKKGLWTVPANRMKAGKEHRVALSPLAIELLKGLPKPRTGLLFPAPRDGEMSDATLKAVIKRMHEHNTDNGKPGYLDPKRGKLVTPHGFRSTFRDWAAEHTNHPREVAEMALAHTIENKVEAAYRRGDLFEKRQALMTDWATYCSEKVNYTF